MRGSGEKVTWQKEAAADLQELKATSTWQAEKVKHLHFIATRKRIRPAPWMSLEANPLPVDLPDENQVLANALIAALEGTQLSCVQTPDSQELWNNQCDCLTVKFVINFYAV